MNTSIGKLELKYSLITEIVAKMRLSCDLLEENTMPFSDFHSFLFIEENLEAKEVV
jgi:hypothetical protein